MIVVDASAVGTFLIPDEAGPFAEFARDTCSSDSLYVPSHWHAELASLIRNAERRGRLTTEQRRHACAIAQTLSRTVVVAPLPSIADVVAASAALSLTVYDTAYFLLAQDLGAALLTEDQALLRAASENGIVALAP